MNSNDLDERVAVVAGGSKGAGLATARLLREAGARVVSIARTAPETADVAFVPADLSTLEGLTTSSEAVAELVGVPDILVHVVGGSRSPAGGGTRRSTTSGARRSCHSTFCPRSGSTA
ncbi:SDR family NAD(P)-dependent oxidoreductase [Streptomyces tendae]|uniref:SDR family NAD(P)-dependent oxidoreductase n=1 Tax=Streptomyces tendae TaxID=1932 RepID=UPI003EC0AAC2